MIDIDAVAERGLRAIGTTRRAGLHYYGNLLGISRDGGGAAPVMRMASDPGTVEGPVSIMALASLADLTLGAAIREAIGAEARLTTVTLDVHHTHPTPRGALSARASVVWSETGGATGQALAECRIHDADDALVGTALGWFMAVPLPEGVEYKPLPWELDDDPDEEGSSTAPASLSEDEDEAFRRTVAAAERAAELGDRAVIDELLSVDWDDSALSAGTARGRLALGPHITNRVGHIQGGALYGAAVACAGRLVDLGRMRLAEAHIQYVKPATGDALEAEASSVRIGRRAAFVSCSLRVGGDVVAVAQLAYRERD